MSAGVDHSWVWGCFKRLINPLDPKLASQPQNVTSLVRLHKATNLAQSEKKKKQKKTIWFPRLNTQKTIFTSSLPGKKLTKPSPLYLRIDLWLNFFFSFTEHLFKVVHQRWCSHILLLGMQNGSATLTNSAASSFSKC